jgi:hypothetical protein
MVVHFGPVWMVHFHPVEAAHFGPVKVVHITPEKVVLLMRYLQVLTKNGLIRLPKTASRRTVHSKRYAKRVLGHKVQVDVKFATFYDSSGKKVKRYQFTAIDDAP